MSSLLGAELIEQILVCLSRLRLAKRSLYHIFPGLSTSASRALPCASRISNASFFGRRYRSWIRVVTFGETSGGR